MENTIPMLKEKISNDLTQAMKRGDAMRVSVLRMVVAAIRNKEIEKRIETLSDEDVLAVLATEARKRKESVASYQQGGRQESAEHELQELEVLKMYLPEEANEDDIRISVKAAIAQTGATGIKDMGKIMKEAMAVLKGKADGTLVQRIVKEELGG